MVDVKFYDGGLWVDNAPKLAAEDWYRYSFRRTLHSESQIYTKVVAWCRNNLNPDDWIRQHNGFHTAIYIRLDESALLMEVAISIPDLCIRGRGRWV